MNRALRFLLRCGLSCAVALLLGQPARAQLQLFHDRAAFTAALAGMPVSVEDYESYAQGVISPGDRRGDFLYLYDPNLLQPAVVPGGNGGQALGGAPFDVFVGEDSLTLQFQPLPDNGMPYLRALGADILYAPSFEDIPADTYRLGLEDGTAAGMFAGNLDALDGAGGTFFLGIIADPAARFTRVRLYSVPPDPGFLVPAYQADNLLYAAVPEPSTLSILAVGGLMFTVRARRRK